MRKVLKFGGSSVATAEQLAQVRNIICGRTDRSHICAVVVSARGRRFQGDVKETDLLIMAYNVLVGRDIGTDVSEADARRVVEMLHGQGPVSEITFDAIWELIAEPLRYIVYELGLDLHINDELSFSKGGIRALRDLDFTKSRGEWHMAYIVSALLGLPRIDAAKVFRFMRSGEMNAEQTLELLADHCNEPCVIPGFYGADIDGKIHTFPRNGSDVTATWVARGLKADVCEIWSDTPGVYMADPRIIPNEELIVLDHLTYREVREAQVQALHEDAVRPLREMASPIPIHMRDTGNPDAPGTWIMRERPKNGRRVQIITGHSGYVAINVYKTGYHDEIGGTATILNVLSIAGVSCHHISTGTDGVMIAVHRSAIRNGTLERVLVDIHANFRPQQIEVDPNREMAVIYLVGEIGCSFEVLGRACCALDSIGIAEGRFIESGGSKGTIVIGVEINELHIAILALHREFAKDVER